MNRTFSLIALGALFALATPAFAAGDAAAGKQKSQPCTACHGPEGNPTDPQYPKLAGQYRDYIEQALKEYKSGKRKNAIMAGFTTTLSDQDIADLSTYFSSLPGQLSDLDHHVQGRD